jgi:hypothetical protein
MAELVPRLQFSKDALRNLAGGLGEYLDDLEDRHSRFFQDIKVWWKWYEGIPQVSRKRWPWYGASNTVAPVIRTAADSIIAQHYAIIHSHRKVWSGRMENEEFADFAPEIINFLNWGARDNEFDMLLPTLDWLTELAVVGESVLGYRWVDRQRYIMVPRSGKPQLATVKRSAIVEHIPRHQIMSEPGRSLEESPIIARQSFFTYTDMIEGVMNNGWDREAVERAKGHPESDSLGYDIERERARDSGRSLDRLGDINKPHDVRTIWVDWPILKALDATPGSQDVKDRSANIMVVYHPRSREVLRVSSDPYGLGHKPYQIAYFKKRGAFGTGMAKMLEGSQRAISTTINQSIDAVTLANAINLVTTDARIAKGQFSPGQPLHVTQTGDVDVLTLPKQVLPDIALVNLLQTYAERVSGVSDPLLGRESRSGGHPSPATNFLGMQQAGRQLQAPTLMGIRQAISRLGEDIATLYQLHGTDPTGRLVRIFGQEDGNIIRSWMFPSDLSIIGNLSLDIFAADEDRNPQARQQHAVALAQMTNNVYGTILPMFQALESGQVGPKTSEALVKAIEANLVSFRRFLQASDVDDMNEYLLAFNEQRQGAVGQLNDFTRLLSESGGGQQAVQEPGNAAGLGNLAAGREGAASPGIGL